VWDSFSNVEGERECAWRTMSWGGSRRWSAQAGSFPSACGPSNPRQTVPGVRVEVGGFAYMWPGIQKGSHAGNTFHQAQAQIRAKYDEEIYW
jgi:hypothetical protein